MAANTVTIQVKILAGSKKGAVVAYAVPVYENEPRDFVEFMYPVGAKFSSAALGRFEVVAHPSSF